MKAFAFLASAAIFIGTPAFAQDVAAPEAPAAEEPALCTDRPTKSNFACTVPEGMFQIELDLFSFTRAEQGGDRSDVLLYTNPTFKYGLTGHSDIEFSIAPLVELRTRAGGIETSQQSVGDLFVRYKHRFTDPADQIQIAAIPYVKIPLTDRGIGNREFEGGIFLPVNISIAPVTLTFVPSVDILADSTNPEDRHIQLTGLVNIGVPLSPVVTLYGELWTAQNYDPAGTIEQYSADVALTWLASPELQLDVGANFGLNAATPDIQAYVGVSTRF